MKKSKKKKSFLRNTKYSIRYSGTDSNYPNENFNLFIFFFSVSFLLYCENFVNIVHNCYYRWFCIVGLFLLRNITSYYWLITSSLSRKECCTIQSRSKTRVQTLLCALAFTLILNNLKIIVYDRYLNIYIKKFHDLTREWSTR